VHLVFFSDLKPFNERQTGRVVHKKMCHLSKKNSLREQVREETEEEPDNQSSYGRWLIKMEEFSRYQYTTHCSLIIPINQQIPKGAWDNLPLITFRTIKLSIFQRINLA